MIADQWLARPREVNRDADISAAVAEMQASCVMGREEEGQRFSKTDLSTYSALGPAALSDLSPY
jgi:hypothetical protein